MAAGPLKMIQRVAGSNGVLLDAMRGLKVGAGLTVTPYPDAALLGEAGGDGVLTGYYLLDATPGVVLAKGIAPLRIDDASGVNTPIADGASHEFSVLAGIDNTPAALAQRGDDGEIHNEYARTFDLTSPDAELIDDANLGLLLADTSAATDATHEGMSPVIGLACNIWGTGASRACSTRRALVGDATGKCFEIEAHTFVGSTHINRKINIATGDETLRGSCTATLFLNGSRPTITQTYATTATTVNAYTTSAQTVAFTGQDNAQGGTPYAKVVDLDALRASYEILRASHDNLLGVVNELIDVLQAFGPIQ